MKLSELLQLVDKQWHGQFLHFIETGEADDKFLAFLNTNKDTQTAVEHAFTAQAAAFEGLAKAISTEPLLPSQREDRTPASTAMTLAIEDVANLPPIQRKEAIQQVATALKSSGRKDRTDVQAVVKDLEEAVALVES